MRHIAKHCIWHQEAFHLASARLFTLPYKKNHWCYYLEIHWYCNNGNAFVKWLFCSTQTILSFPSSYNQFFSKKHHSHGQNCSKKDTIINPQSIKFRPIEAIGHCSSKSTSINSRIKKYVFVTFLTQTFLIQVGRELWNIFQIQKQTTQIKKYSVVCFEFSVAICTTMISCVGSSESTMFLFQVFSIRIYYNESQIMFFIAISTSWSDIHCFTLLSQYNPADLNNINLQDEKYHYLGVFVWRPLIFIH